MKDGTLGLLAMTLRVLQQGSLGFVGASGLKDTGGESLIGNSSMHVQREKKSKRSKSDERSMGVKRGEEGRVCE